MGPWALVGVLLIIFAETGLLIGFFLPGDSLLFMLGAFVGANTIKQSIWLVLPLVFLAATLGTQSGYFIGHVSGPKIFNKPDSRFFKQEYVERSQAFFDKHGGPAIILAQFVPIVRTFTPVIAGVAKMRYRHFFAYNIIGALLWGCGVTLLGFAFGNVSFIQSHIDVILVAIVVISVLPMVIAALRGRSKGKTKESEEA
jgi:membrane-associated protein